jgi:DNA-binding beta-propeller fold protein YncE
MERTLSLMSSKWTNFLLSAAISAAGACAWAAPAHAAENPPQGVPVFELDPDWPKIPENFRAPFVSGILIDSEDNAWLTTRRHRSQPDGDKVDGPAIMIFDPDGNYLRGIGGPGEGYEWPYSEHNSYIDPNGFVWVSGDACGGRTPGEPDDDQILKFTQDGDFVMQIGRSNAGAGDADTQNFRRPPNVQVHPETNELFVADGYGNHRIIVFDAETGAYKRMWGAFGNPPSYSGEQPCFPQEAERFEGVGAMNFSIPHVLLLSHDDLLYVADRNNRRIQIFTPEGEFVRQVVRYDAPFARNLAFSPDEDETYLYTGYGEGIAMFERKTMEFIGMIEIHGVATGPGHQITMDSKGNLYVTGGAMGELPERPTAGRLIFKGMSASQ